MLIVDASNAPSMQCAAVCRYGMYELTASLTSVPLHRNVLPAPIRQAGSAGLVTHSAKASRHFGSAKPKVRSNFAVPSTP